MSEASWMQRHIEKQDEDYPSLHNAYDPMSIISMPRWKAEQFDRELSALKAEVKQLRWMLQDGLDWSIEGADDLFTAGYDAGVKRGEAIRDAELQQLRQTECLYQSERLVCESYRKDCEQLKAQADGVLLVAQELAELRTIMREIAITEPCMSDGMCAWCLAGLTSGDEHSDTCLWWRSQKWRG